MATQNFTVGSTWVRLAADTDDPLLISCEARAVVEFATTATDADPGASVKGHRLMMGDGFALTRASGIVAVSGVFEFEKETAANTLSAGHSVNINSDGKVEQPGATEVDGITRCGITMANSANGDTHVDIDISAAGIGGTDG